MISEARILANRRNAQKSTGPKTEAGKMVSRCNGLVHGKRAKILSMPVLPQENPRDLECLVAEFVRDGRPANTMERSLLVRAARLTWMLDRSDRAESAHLAGAVRARARANSRPSRADSSEARSRRVRDLGVQLFHPLTPREDRDSDWQDDPASCLAGLEETREGCRWLLDQWRSIRAYLVAGRELLIGDFYRFIRLHGRKVTDLFWDLDLNAVMAAAEVAFEGASREIYAHYLRGLRAEEFGVYEQGRQWRTFAPLPATKEEAMAFLLADAEAEMDRLAALLCDEEEVDEDAAAFAAERELDHHRRTVAARNRELMQTLEMLRKMQKERGGSGMATRDPAELEIAPEADAEPMDPSRGGSPLVPSPHRGRGLGRGGDRDRHANQPQQEASPLVPSPLCGGGSGRGGGLSEPSIAQTFEDPGDSSLLDAQSLDMSDSPLSLTLPHTGGRGPELATSALGTDTVEDPLSLTLPHGGGRGPELDTSALGTDTVEDPLSLTLPHGGGRGPELDTSALGTDTGEDPLSLTLPHEGGRGSELASSALGEEDPSNTEGPELATSALGEEEAIEPEPEPIPEELWEAAEIEIAEDEHEPLPEDVRNPKLPEPTPRAKEEPPPKTQEEVLEWLKSKARADDQSERTQELTPGQKELQKFTDLLTLNLDTPIGRAPDYRKLPKRE